MSIESRSVSHSHPTRRAEASPGARVVSGLGSVRIDHPGEHQRADRSGWIERLNLRLGPHELRRRMVHIAPGFLPFLLWPIPHEDPLSATLMNIMIGLAVGISGWAWYCRSAYSRRGERSLASAVFGYAAVVLGMLILFPSAPELGLTVMAILAFGDGSATLAGLFARGRPLPWNPRKSWAGSVAFLTCSIPLATVIYWGEAQPGVGVAAALACVTPAAFVAALAESVPSRINDNVRVGVAAAMTILPAHAIFVGW